MKKQFAAVIAATAILGATTAFAANPFSDVSSDSWAYQSVAQLANSGIVTGYPDGTFKGGNSITRYEMAQMVAKAMANQDRANAEQQAMINRLANEFSDELNNLGVRVSNLENKVGNVKVTGDARLRYQGNENKVFNNGTEKSRFDYRGRIQMNATVNDDTQAVVRFTTGSNEFGNSNHDDNDDHDSSEARFDRVYINHDFNDYVSVTAGRFGEVIGAGLMYDDTFDGAKVSYNSDKVNAEVGYGYAVAGLFDDKNVDENASMTFANLKGKFGPHTSLGGFYVWGNNHTVYQPKLTAPQNNDGSDDIYGFNADFNFGKTWVGGEWLKMTDTDDSSAWVAGIGYGNFDMANKGTWDVKAQYFDQDVNAPIWSSTWNQAYDLTNTNNGYKGWMATVDYALAKNVGLSAYYGFSGEDQDGKDLGDYYRADLNVQF